MDFRTVVIKTLLSEDTESDSEEMEKNSSEHMRKIKEKHNYSKNGISPKMAKDIDDHVKKYGHNQIYNHFGSADGDNPHWWDGKNKKVKKLKQVWTVDEH